MLLFSLIFLLQQSFAADTIRLGLLIQDKQSLAARQGAELAIREANRSSKSGKYFALEVRDMEGPWGTGAKESVSLVFDDEVWAVIGCVDGRNSHLAEQVSAKTRVPFISAWSGDPTLGQAFIPWFFSVVPNDEQTAELILKEIEKNGNNSTLIVSHDDYDSEMAASSFIKKTAARKTKAPGKITYQNAGKELPLIAQKSAGNEVIFFGPAADLALLLDNKEDFKAVYAPLLLMAENYPEALINENFSEVILSDPSNARSEKFRTFSASFRKAYNKNPGPVAAYSYDAVNLMIEGINQSLGDRTLLFRKISALKFHGATGEISFDERGNRKFIPGLCKAKDCSFID